MPLDREVKTIIMSGDLEEESDSFSEHDSIDSYEQITIKAKQEDAEKAQRFYRTLDKY